MVSRVECSIPFDDIGVVSLQKFGHFITAAREAEQEPKQTEKVEWSPHAASFRAR